MSPIVPSQHGVTPLSDATASTVPVTQPSLAHVTATMTGDQEAATFSSIAMSVDLHIDSKSRAKIQGNSYVDFGGLLSHRDQTTEQYQLLVTGDSISAML